MVVARGVVVVVARGVVVVVARGVVVVVARGVVVVVARGVVVVVARGVVVVVVVGVTRMSNRVSASSRQSPSRCTSRQASSRCGPGARRGTENRTMNEPSRPTTVVASGDAGSTSSRCIPISPAPKSEPFTSTVSPAGAAVGAAPIVGATWAVPSAAMLTESQVNIATPIRPMGSVSTATGLDGTRLAGSCR